MDQKSEKISSEFKDMILDMHKSGTRPVQIHARLQEKFGDKFHFNIEQVRYLTRKNQDINIAPAVCLGDLIAWARSIRTVPNDIDTPFVLAMTHLNNKFHIVFSTLRLLSLAKHSPDVFSADTTYQTHWQEYPLNIVGCFDKMNQFHMLADFDNFI